MVADQARVDLVAGVGEEPGGRDGKAGGLLQGVVREVVRRVERDGEEAKEAVAVQVGDIWCMGLGGEG